jgi:hypothetical protein
MNITSVQLLDSNAAVVSLYAVERLKGNATILFIDIGASQCEFSLWKLERGGSVTTITLKDFRFSDEIGGLVIDQLLIEKVIGGLSRAPTTAERVAILRNVRKVKETLAAHGNYVIDLSEDFQKVITLSNDVVAEVAEPVLKKLSKLIEGIETPDEIEMVGGASRLPSFVSVIQNAFPNLPLRRSLNSDEAVATGAAYYASLQTGTIAGTRLEFRRPAMYGLNLKALNQTFELFRRGEFIERKSVTMRRFNDFSFLVELSPEKARNLRIQSSLYDHVPIQFKSIAITGLTNLTRNVTKQLATGTRPYIRFAFGHSEVLDCPDFISASLNANVTVNITIEGEVNSVDSAPMNWGLPTKVTPSDPAFDFDVAAAKQFMLEFNETRADRKRHAAAAHKIEAFIIDLNDKLSYDSDFQAVTTEEERSIIHELLSRERQTIEVSAARVPAVELEKRLEKLKEKIGRTLLRYDELKHRPSAIRKLNRTIGKAEQDMAASKTDQETIDEFASFLRQSKSMMNQALELKPLDDPHILAKDIIEREKQLFRKLPDLRKPARKPQSISFSNDPTDPDYEKKVKQLKKIGINVGPPKPKEVEKEPVEVAATRPMPPPEETLHRTDSNLNPPADL